ncbi:MAG: ribulose-phosphate 3-epimerase [Bacilli bacterium]|nr:ribulose-phosphate 3-epimerase [Bacilli bacterium]
MKVSVSILKEKNNKEEVIDKLLNTSADYIHLDIMDSTFTNSSSFDLNDFKLVNKKYDIHIMSTDLDNQINKAIKLNPEYISFHYESTKEIDKYIELIKKHNIKVGLAISPKTKLYKIKKYLDKIDMLLILSVVPGLGGQTYIEKVTKKIIKANKIKKNYLISVDGGINNDTINKIKEYVDIVVAGSYITDSEDYENRIMSLKK